MAGPASVEEYLAALPEDARAGLHDLRTAILDAAPGSTEVISYQMPAVRSAGRIVVWYGAFAKHYSLFPASARVIEALGDELQPFVSGKGTIRFDRRKPLPLALVRKIVRLRLEENASRSSA